MRRLVEARAEKADGGVHAHQQHRHTVLIIRGFPFRQLHPKADHVQPLWCRASSQPPPAEKSQNTQRSILDHKSKLLKGQIFIIGTQKQAKDQ